MNQFLLLIGLVDSRENSRYVYTCSLIAVLNGVVKWDREPYDITQPPHLKRKSVNLAAMVVLEVLTKTEAKTSY